jgi:hypothetical protein
MEDVMSETRFPHSRTLDAIFAGETISPQQALGLMEAVGTGRVGFTGPASDMVFRACHAALSNALSQQHHHQADPKLAGRRRTS